MTEKKYTIREATKILQGFFDEAIEKFAAADEVQQNEAREELYGELIRSADPVYFSQKYGFQDLSGDGIKLTLDQIKWLTTDDRVVSLGEARQTFRTSTMLARAVHQAIFRPDQMILYVGNNLRMADHANSCMRGIVQRFGTMAPVIKYMNRREIEFDNGSKIKFAAATPKVARGYSLNLVLLDNMEAVKWQVYDEMMQNIMPCVSTWTQVMEAR